ncbi:MAG: site-specific integrase [Deltaproteobacteria bacterium]|nr:site-specific integrase [Deltaproteobacteria bacterium]
MTPLAPHLEAFFTDRLRRQKSVSPNTVAAYRDAFCLLLRFAQARLGKDPSKFTLTDIDASLVAAFLDSLEKERGNAVRTRNVRLAAIRSFFRFLALREPAYSALIQRVLAIPQKRHTRRVVGFLTQPEVAALVAAPDQSSLLGRRDHLLLVVTIETGMRVSEIIRLCIHDVTIAATSQIRCTGKGRKERITPVGRHTAPLLRRWIDERRAAPTAPLFPARHGGHLSRDAVERLVDKYAILAADKCPTLSHKKVSPHVLRHTTAVRLLQAGVDSAVIALILGHESVETTQMYFDADLSAKERAFERTAPIGTKKGRYRPATSEVMAFLKSL